MSGSALACASTPQGRMPLSGQALMTAPQRTSNPVPWVAPSASNDPSPASSETPVTVTSPAFASSAATSPAALAIAVAKSIMSPAPGGAHNGPWFGVLQSSAAEAGAEYAGGVRMG